jgi:2-oxoisovalerate dehydrogenase E1 component
MLNHAFEQAFSHIRKTGKPFCQIVHNYRLGPHSKGDDFRDKQEVESWREKDPINYLKEKFGGDYCENQKQKILLEMEAIISELENEECISIADYHKSYKKSLAVYQKPETFLSRHHDKVLTCIQASLDAVMNDDDRIILIGEDICDPYGGAFKVTRNLSTKYPDRVVNTPISEAALVGTGIGLALNGMIPVVEIMFGDFISLCFDQLLNHGVKYSWVYGNGIKVPLIVRVPMGAGRGYGPTHSQSLEKFLTGIPLLSVMAISVIFDVKKLYEYALTTTDNPLIIIENKKMYGERVMRYENGKIGSFFVQEVCHAQFPSVKLSLDMSSNADCILITYGGMVTTAMEAAETLMLNDEIQLDIVVITQLSPLPQSDLLDLITSDCVGTLEEGTLTNGIGSEIIAFLSEAMKDKNYFRIATDNIPIPNGNALEDQIVPDKNRVADKIRSLYNGK